VPFQQTVKLIGAEFYSRRDATAPQGPHVEPIAFAFAALGPIAAAAAIGLVTVDSATAANITAINFIFPVADAVAAITLFPTVVAVTGAHHCY